MTAPAADWTAFARWALPERSNATRGLCAEWLVMRAVDADVTEVRDEWGDHDVITPDGITIEVKSAAHLQAWENANPSPIGFSGLRARWQNAAGTAHEGEPDYRSDVYVFAVHTATDPDSYDVWDLDQWQFRVVARSALVDLDQSSIRLSRLHDLGHDVVSYDHLAAAIAYHSGR